MPKPIILYRRGLNPDSDEQEINAAKQYFEVIYQRTLIHNSLVIGRMSVLPFYKELELDLHNNNCKLINSYRQHQFIADMREWCEVLGDSTPRLYTELHHLPNKGPFVLKGQTNSKKFLWDTHMFANDKSEAIQVYSRLCNDLLLSDQTIYARDYIPLIKLGEGLHGLPITKEFRFFIAYGKILCGGFYWASHAFDLKNIPSPEEVPKEFLNKIINQINNRANFYALDVAQTQNGEWIVIEINDGQMSGLSMNDPEELYKKLSEIDYSSSS